MIEKGKGKYSVKFSDYTGLGVSHRNRKIKGQQSSGGQPFAKRLRRR
jgi:hypothetical protein